MNNGNISPEQKEQKPRFKPSKFLNMEYYQSKPKDVAEIMLKTGIDISKFYSFESKPLPITGKFPVASLSRIELKDEQNNSLGSVVLKQSEASQTKEIIKDKQSSQQTRDIAEYQFNHLTFGCDRLLPFTHAYDYQRLKAEDMDDKADKGRVSNILLEYWPEPSLDQNLLYLDSILANYVTRLKDDPKLDDAAKKQIKSDMEQISNVKDDLIKKSIDTIVDIATYGTYFLKNPEKDHPYDKIKVFQMSDIDKVDKSVRKAQEMGFWLTLYNALVQKIISFEDIKTISFEEYSKDPKTLPENVKHLGNKLSECHQTIGETIKTIISPITDPKNKVYQQGDETPVHLIYRKFGDTIKMGLLDLDRARMDNIYTSFSKACLGSIQNLNYNQMEKYLEYLSTRRKQVAKQLAGEKGIDVSKIYVEEDFKKSKKDYDEISVYELLKIEGKESRFYLNFHNECEESIKSTASILKNFKNKYLVLPNSPFFIDSGISYTSYLPQEYIPKALDLYKENLEMIINGMEGIKEKTVDEERKLDALSKLYSVSKKNFLNK